MVALVLWQHTYHAVVVLAACMLSGGCLFDQSLTGSTSPCTAGGVVEYKYVLLDHSGNHAVAWQQGNNSVLALRSSDDVVEVFDNW